MSMKRLTWTKTPVTLLGTVGGEVLIAGDLDRYAIVIYNRKGNSQIDVDISNAAAALAANGGRSLDGGEEMSAAGTFCPDGPVKVFGTAGNIVNVWTAK